MMMRSLLLLSTLLFSLTAHAEGFLTRLLHHPVPGGVAVLNLGDGSQPPQASFNGKPVMVVKEEGTHWIAVVGIDLDYEVMGERNGMLMVSASGTAVVVE